MRSLKELAKEAIEVQDACNLSGVIHAWDRAVVELRQLIPNQDTDFYNTHPINQMYASKVHDLTQMGLSDYDSFAGAYHDCKNLAERS